MSRKMPQGCKKVLMFEDDREHGLAVLDAIEAELKPGETVEVTWFNWPFSMPSNAQRELGLPYPIRVPKRRRPEVYEVTSRGVQNHIGGEEYWQGQFDAAIFDVIFKNNSMPVGEWFASWMAYARFRGLVFMVSIAPIANVPATLPNLRTVTRKADGDWAKQIAQGIAGVPPRGPRETLTDFRGRSQDRLFGDFWASRREPPPRAPIAYFGNDGKLAQSLSAFFAIPLAGDGTILPLDQAEKVLQADRKAVPVLPGVIVVDCGPDGTVDDALINEITRLDEGLRNHPVWLVLGRARALADSGGFDRLNARFVSREQIERAPSVWAAGSAETLHQAYANFARAYPYKQLALKGDDSTWDRGTVTAARQLLGALLPLIALARAMDKLVVGEPTLVEWLGPQWADTLNSSFSSIPRQIVRALHRQGHVTERQVALFAPKTQERRAKAEEEEA